MKIDHQKNVMGKKTKQRNYPNSMTVSLRQYELLLKTLVKCSAL